MEFSGLSVRRVKFSLHHAGAFRMTLIRVCYTHLEGSLDIEINHGPVS